MLLYIIIIACFKLDLICSKRTGHDVATDLQSKNILDSNVITKIVPSKPITLTCTRPGKNSTAVEVVWYYQNCITPVCNSTLKESNGYKICSVPSKPACSTRMLVEKPLPGLYKCFKIEKKIGYVSSATPIITYNLKILERDLEPVFLEEPEDIETYVGMNVLFKCKIKSSLPLHVKWYKRVNKSPGAFQYENKFYQLLNTTEVSKHKDVFLSKLHLKKVTIRDAGTYACGGINEAGIRYNEANLTIAEFQNDFHEPDTLLKAHWKIILFTTATIFLVFVVKCVACIHFIKSSSNSQADTRRRRRPWPPQRSDNKDLDTSDYEHVNL
ncbi:fibroblast growth factor receptor 1 isoform X2 [Cimex lectularius]|uniref:receptor protein-tyrosine kinase n=1 Tax=Cimex lectularius TaxID=79782 RepID=A0A8I6SGN4_CIMLE|nr:fibroblast growth factor receptor 1 isoform X2 [Cimex lectularius]